MASIKKRIRPGRTPDFRGRIWLPNGEQISHCAPTRAEVKAWADEAEESIRKGTFIDPARSKMTFGEWVDWLEAHPVGLLRPSTRARDASYVKNHLRPHFEDWPLGQITAFCVQRWVDALTLTHAPATADKAFSILSKLLDAAIRDNRLAVNPCRAAKAHSIPDDEARFLTTSTLSDSP
ncbi:MAG TPA: hypothetical protein VI854_01895 [Acidimicrobiia bacterium]|nr:hypothetical protein [Acidimicrobiia bacterium]